MRPQLVVPSLRWRESVLHALSAWEGEYHGWNYTLAKDLDLSSQFEVWVERLINDEARPHVDGWSTSTTRWLVDGDQFLGTGQLRHELATDYLRRRGGHIGYSVVEQMRGRGLSHVIMDGAIREARARHLPRVLVTCLENNPASAAVIRRAGGVEDLAVKEPGLLRFWIEL